MNPDLELKRRTLFGKETVAPFIDGYGVWDIPASEWTPDIEQAVLHAYALGWRHCNHRHEMTPNISFSSGAKFPKETKE